MEAIEVEVRYIQLEKKSNNVVFTSSTAGTINSIETIEDGSYQVNIENDNGEITTEAVPVGPQLIVKAEDGIRDPDWSRGLGDVYKRQ